MVLHWEKGGREFAEGAALKDFSAARQLRQKSAVIAALRTSARASMGVPVRNAQPESCSQNQEHELGREADVW